MQPRNLIYFGVACCMVSCSEEKIGSIPPEEISQIEIRSVDGSYKAVISDAKEITVIVEWLNETLQSPLPKVSLKNLPPPINPLILSRRSGASETFLISRGSASAVVKNSKTHGLVEQFTVMKVRDRKYTTELRPKSLRISREQNVD